MFRAPLCPSSGAQEYYTMIAACGIWCCGFQLLVWCGAEGYVSGLQDAAKAATSEFGTPSRRGYVVPIKMKVK